MSKYTSRKKKKTPEELSIEAEGAKIFGKHVTKEKGYILWAATLLACAMPMVLGGRMWSQIPEIVPSGLIGANGEDDSIPRWMVAFGLSGIMCILDFLCHLQLYVHQKKMTVPPPYVRLVGRWGFPILSVIFCSGMIRQSVGMKALDVVFIAPCALGLLLMILGGHMFDCPRKATVALRFSFTEKNDRNWTLVHRMAGCCWLIVGLLLIFNAMLTFTLSPIMIGVVLLALVAPVLYGSRLGT